MCRHYIAPSIILLCTRFAGQDVTPGQTWLPGAAFFVASMLTQARVAKGTYHRKSSKKKTIAALLWRGFLMNRRLISTIFLRDRPWNSQEDNPPEKKPTQNKKVCLNKFFRTIPVGFLTRVTGKKAKVRANFSKKFAWTRCFFLKVPEGHKHRVTTPGTLGKSRGPPQNPAETPRNPRRDPAEPSERPPQSPLRGKFPRRASRRVVPLGWWPSGTLEFFGIWGFWV